MNKNAFMKRALQLALKGGVKVFPNPQVGCVIVKNGKIISEGYHKFFGDRHAEIHAINNTKENLTNAEMYITLEPCSHFGKTPPCVDEIIKSGIKKVYIGIVDPNPLVKGNGIKKLKNAGIEIETGLLKNDLKKYYSDYIKRFSTKRQRVVLKYAMTVDGKIATVSGDSKWISSEDSRKLVYKLRSQFDGILVGVNTVIKDDPILTSHGEGKNPVKIVLDPELIIPLKRKIFTADSPLVIIHSMDEDNPKIELLRKKGAILLRLEKKNGRINFEDVCKSLKKISIFSLLIEGGGETAWWALKDKVVDELIVFIGPKIIGGIGAVTPVEGEGIKFIKNAFPLKLKSIKRISSDLMLKYKILAD